MFKLLSIYGFHAGSVSLSANQSRTNFRLPGSLSSLFQNGKPTAYLVAFSFLFFGMTPRFDLNYQCEGTVSI